MPEPKLYTDLADWWPLLSAPVDYAEEAGFYTDLLLEACSPRTLVELGSGGGNCASHMKRSFEMTLVDRSEAMLEVSRRLNPECTHVLGDMRDVRLGLEFDAVFIHDAVSYLVSEGELQRALSTAALHCRVGGAVLIVPDDFAETFKPGTSSGGHDGDGRAMRYLQWNHPPPPGSTQHAVDFAFLLRDDRGTRAIHDRHECGLFPRQTWLELCAQAGLEPGIRKVVHTDLAPEESELLVCRRQGQARRS